MGLRNTISLCGIFAMARGGHHDTALEGLLQDRRRAPVATEARCICRIKMRGERRTGTRRRDVAEVVEAVVREQVADARTAMKFTL